MLRGINVVSIPVPDLDSARTFYAETLGLGTPVHDLPEAGWIEFASGGQSGNVSVTTEGWEGPRGGATIVFDVEDIAAAVEWLRGRGVRCDDPQTFPGYVTFASFFDPSATGCKMCSPA